MVLLMVSVLYVERSLYFSSTVVVLSNVLSGVRPRKKLNRRFAWIDGLGRRGLPLAVNRKQYLTPRSEWVCTAGSVKRGRVKRLCTIELVYGVLNLRNTHVLDLHGISRQAEHARGTLPPRHEFPLTVAVC